ncbi:MAG: BrnA antitoxin family protein [Nitratireductor sp.]|nr:BrnA antitoxin family protein [Nitratireductor sp.]
MSRKNDGWAERQWTREDFRKAKPASELPDAVAKAFPKTRGPQKAPRKVPVSIRLDADVVEHYKATGPGWQARINQALLDTMKRAS